MVDIDTLDACHIECKGKSIIDLSEKDPSHQNSHDSCHQHLAALL